MRHGVAGIGSKPYAAPGVVYLPAGLPELRTEETARAADVGTSRDCSGRFSESCCASDADMVSAVAPGVEITAGILTHMYSGTAPALPVSANVAAAPPLIEPEIRLLGNGGLRVSELVSLRWRNLIDGVANITGKSRKPRVVRLSRGTWQEIQALRTDETFSDDRRAGIKDLPVSPHSLRHSQDTHALRRGHRSCHRSRTLGHQSISTTGRYLDARPDKSSGDYLAL